MIFFIILIAYVAIPSQPENDQSSIKASTTYSSVTAQRPLLKTAIVDQLSTYSPTSDFVQRAETILFQAGFKVDVYDPKQVTVSLYKSLARHGYKLIVLRVHGGVSEEMEGHPVGLFTTESKK